MRVADTWYSGSHTHWFFWLIGQSEGQTEKSEQFDVVLDLLTRKPMSVATTGPSFSNY